MAFAGTGIRADEPGYRGRCGATSAALEERGPPGERRPRSCCSAASPPASTWTCCSRRGRAAPLPGRVRRPGRHEPRRAAAPRGARRARSSPTCRCGAARRGRGHAAAAPGALPMTATARAAPARVRLPLARLTTSTLRVGGRTVDAHQPGQVFWPEAGHHQARPAPVLRRRRAGAAAAPARPRDGDEALPERHRTASSSS